VILFEITGTEAHQVYQELQISNGLRQYDFLRSIVDASIKMNRSLLSQNVLKALNFHAITCLHTNAGEYRPCEVQVGPYKPPAFYRVSALMDDFTNLMNRMWDSTDAVVLGAIVLWQLNAIHPFINGNGRTARAACYFVICVKAGKWLPGTMILPELIKRDHADYVTALKAADASVAAGNLDLRLLHGLLQRLLQEQLNSAGPTPSPAAKPAGTP